MAKYWTTDLLCEVTDAGVQLHGGYGYTTEYPIGKAWVDARDRPDLRRHQRDHEGAHRQDDGPVQETDMPSVTKTVDLPGTPEEAFALATDPARFGEWLTIHDSWPNGEPGRARAGRDVHAEAQDHGHARRRQLDRRGARRDAHEDDRRGPDGRAAGDDDQHDGRRRRLDRSPTRPSSPAAASRARWATWSPRRPATELEKSLAKLKETRREHGDRSQLEPRQARPVGRAGGVRGHEGARDRLRRGDQRRAPQAPRRVSSRRRCSRSCRSFEMLDARRSSAVVPRRDPDARRPRRAGLPLPPADRARADARVARRRWSASTAARAASRSSIKAITETRGGRAGRRAVHDGVLPRRAARRVARARPRTEHGFPEELRGAEPLARSRTATTPTRRSATARRRATRCRSTSTTTSRSPSACRGSSSTACARWRSRRAR